MCDPTSWHWNTLQTSNQDLPTSQIKPTESQTKGSVLLTSICKVTVMFLKKFEKKLKARPQEPKEVEHYFIKNASKNWQLKNKNMTIRW